MPSVCHSAAPASALVKGVVISTAKRRNLLPAGSEHTAGDSRFLTANDAVRNDKARAITFQ